MKKLIAAPMSGSSTIQRMKSTGCGLSIPHPYPLSAQGLGRTDVNRAEILVNRQYYGEANHCFCSSQHNHKNRKNLAVVIICICPSAATVERKRNIVDIRGIKNQFDTKQDADGVPARKHTISAEQKQHQPQYQEVSQAECARHGRYSRVSWREITTAPINAASSTTDAISKSKK